MRQSLEITKRITGRSVPLMLSVAVLATCGCNVLGPFQSYSPPSEGWMFEFDGRPWKADHRARDHQQAIVEYVLPGENVQRWTELVTTNLYFHPPHRVSVEAFMNMSKVLLEEDCPSLRWTVLKNEPDNTIYEWRHNGCQGHPPQHQIQRLAVGQLGIHSLSYVSKTPKLSDSVREAWIHLLESAEVQGKP